MDKITNYFIKKTILIVLGLTRFQDIQVNGHGMMLDPPNRSSLWRFPEFEKFNPTINFNDNELFCGGFGVMLQNDGRCGVCGDNYVQTRPRDNESGGKFGKGIITRSYISGQVIPIRVEITTNHSGTFQFHLCPRNDLVLEEEECFRYLLPFADGTGFSKFYYFEKIGGTVDTTLTLPPGVRCDHCIIRWHYRTGNNWGSCNNGTSAIGCGDQEVFRNCADVAIH